MSIRVAHVHHQLVPARAEPLPGTPALSLPMATVVVDDPVPVQVQQGAWGLKILHCRHLHHVCQISALCVMARKMRIQPNLMAG